jgi:hypothetical protein
MLLVILKQVQDDDDLGLRHYALTRHNHRPLRVNAHR